MAFVSVYCMLFNSPRVPRGSTGTYLLSTTTAILTSGISFQTNPRLGGYPSLNFVFLISKSLTSLLTPPRSFANLVACSFSFSGIFI